MRKLFNCEVGLSDHTMGIGASVVAVAHGATVIEKHFTLNRSDGGVDSAFSMEPEEMKSLVIETERAWQSLGKITYGPSEAEKGSLAFRRSLYIAVNMKKGDILTEKNLRIVRPGLGLEPKFYDILLRRKVNQDLTEGTALKWDLVV
jgi:sialic acid synthase SpsE